MLGRRAFLGTSSAVTAAAFLVGRKRTAHADHSCGRSPEAPFFDGIAVEGWRVVRAGFHLGAFAFVVEGEYGRFQLDVLRRDESGPACPAVSPTLAVYAHGQTGRRTEEALQHASLMLAAALTERERTGALVPQLLTMSERLAQHPQGAFHVDVEADLPRVASRSDLVRGRKQRS